MQKDGTKKGFRASCLPVITKQDKKTTADLHRGIKKNLYLGGATGTHVLAILFSLGSSQCSLRRSGSGRNWWPHFLPPSSAAKQPPSTPLSKTDKCKKLWALRSGCACKVFAPSAEGSSFVLPRDARSGVDRRLVSRWRLRCCDHTPYAGGVQRQESSLRYH